MAKITKTPSGGRIMITQVPTVRTINLAADSSDRKPSNITTIDISRGSPGTKVRSRNAGSIERSRSDQVTQELHDGQLAQVSHELQLQEQSSSRFKPAHLEMKAYQKKVRAANTFNGYGKSKKNSSLDLEDLVDKDQTVKILAE